MQELIEAAKGDAVPETKRRFLSWDEAREMNRDGMAIGSHTQSHAVLGQLTRRGQQLEELVRLACDFERAIRRGG